MAGVTAEIALRINAQQVGSADLGSPRMTLDPIGEIMQFVSGTDAIGKLDLLFSDTRTLAGSANEDLDLAGALTDAFGATLAMAELVVLFVKAKSGANTINVTRPASNGVPIFLAAGDGVPVLQGEYFLFVSQKGVAVTAGTGDKLNITNTGSGNVTYDIVALGRSVAA